MTITKDAFNIILYIYKEKVNTGNIPQNDDIYKKTGWTPIRYKNAFKFCVDSDYIEIWDSADTFENGIPDIDIRDLTPNAIILIEKGESKEGKQKIYTLFNIENFNLDSIIKGEFSLFK
jgi:hypothetical protein